MDIKVAEERPNPLLHRKEYVVEIGHGAQPTPKREEVRKALAELLHVNKDLLVIERMRATFGAPRSRSVIHAYESKEALERTVRTHIQVRNGLRAKEAKATKAAPAAPAPAAPEPAKKE